MHTYFMKNLFTFSDLERITVGLLIIYSNRSLKIILAILVICITFSIKKILQLMALDRKISLNAKLVEEGNF